MREKKIISFPKRKKSLIPGVIPVKMCPCVFSAEFQQKHLRGNNHEFSSVGPWERRNSFLAATFSFPAKLMKISFP